MHGVSSSMNMESINLFEILVRENASMLTAYLRSVVRDSATVDDLFQETMLAAWKNIHRFDRTKPFGPWLRGIAARVVLAHHRKAAKGVYFYDEAVLEHLESRFRGLERQTGGNFEEKLACLRDCVKQLPGLLRKVIDRRYAKRLSQREMALEFGVTGEAVPRPKIDLHVPACCGIIDSRQQGILVAVRLLPEDRVHLLCGLDEQRNHLALALTQIVEVGRQANRCVLIHEALNVVLLRLASRHDQTYRCQAKCGDDSTDQGHGISPRLGDAVECMGVSREW